MAASDRKPSYLRAAFWNVYNLSMLSGVTFAGLATGEPWLLAVGAAAEALWLLFSTDNARFRRAVDAQYSEKTRIEAIRRMQEDAALLPHAERLRVQNLGARAAEVKAEVQRNPRIVGDFMRTQLERLDELVTEYVHLAVTASRSESYLSRTDSKQINRDREAQRRIAESADDQGTRDIARQNREILEKRLTIMEELERFVGRARAQMSLIENATSLLRDQAMTMSTPEALSQQLDSLIASVDAMRDATRSAEGIVGSSVSIPPIASSALEEAGGPLSTESDATAERNRRRDRDRT